MYVDDSGSPSYVDHTKYFVLSGVIVHDENIKNLQKLVFEYKQDNFVGRFIDSEIHTHDIYKAKKDFESISLDKKTELLDNLYDTIQKIVCVGIIIIINKEELRKKNPTWKVFNTTWSFLIERYDKYLEDNDIERER